MHSQLTTCAQVAQVPADEKRGWGWENAGFFQGAVTLIVRIESSWKIVSLVCLFVRVSMQLSACSRNLLLNAPFAIRNFPFAIRHFESNSNSMAHKFQCLSPRPLQSLNPLLAGLSGKCT